MWFIIFRIAVTNVKFLYNDTRFLELTVIASNFKRYGVIGPHLIPVGNAVERAWSILELQQANP